MTFPTGTVSLSVGTVNPMNITISWGALTTNTGGLPITFYAVEYSSTSSSSGFVQLNSYSEGLYTQYTHVSSTIFPSGGYVYYRVRAVNSVGYSSYYSAVLQVTCDSIPTSQTPPVYVAGSVKPYSVQLTWSDPGASGNGGDTISFFLL